MKVINVQGLVLQFDSNSSTIEEVMKVVEEVVEACNCILSDANINCQPQLKMDKIEILELEFKKED